MKHPSCTRSWTGHHRLPRPLCQEHHRGCGGQPAPPAHRSSGCAVHPLADPRFRHLPAGRDGGSHDEAEGAGQDPRHRCIQRHCGHHPRLLQVRPAGCHSGKVQSAHPPCGKAAAAYLQGAGRIRAGILSAGAGPADRQGDYGNHLSRGQHPQLEPQLPAGAPLLRRWICWQNGAT